MSDFKQAQEKKDKKKGNNLKWINKVQGKGGVDGRMDEGTVSAAEFAER